MNTKSNNGQPDNKRDTAHADIRERKNAHVNVCISDESHIENGNTGFDHMWFVHHALPELSFEQIDTTTSFLGEKVSLPCMISSITGGGQDGYQINRDLVIAAQRAKIPVGLGSMRVLFRYPALSTHFAVKKIAPDVPVVANLGAVQLLEIPHRDIAELVAQLEVQALSLHLNVGQELFQPEGDYNFCGIYDAIGRFCEISPVPVIVKETGHGMAISEIERLRNIGVQYIDIAGAGGTNWISVEAHRHPPEHTLHRTAAHFAAWGNPTALILEALDKKEGIIASGGIRTGMDIAKALALGSTMTTLALPFIKLVCHNGVEGVLSFIEELGATLKRIMMLTSSPAIADLKRATLIKTESFCHAAQQFRKG